MSKQNSIMRLVAMAVGLSIVVSSCGIQNQAGDSAGSGRTKNYALVNGQACYESNDEYWNHVRQTIDHWNANYYNWFPQGNVYPMSLISPAGFAVGVDYQNDPSGFADAYWAPFRSEPKIGGCEELRALAGDNVVEGTPTIAAGAVNVRTCIKPETQRSMIDGYNEQIAKTDYPADWSAAMIADYQDEMKRGLATAENAWVC
jgi:hypothetical protein